MIICYKIQLSSSVHSLVLSQANAAQVYQLNTTSPNWKDEVCRILETYNQIISRVIPDKNLHLSNLFNCHLNLSVIIIHILNAILKAFR